MSVYCLFAAHYLPYLGGVERYTFNLARTLCGKGHRVIIVTSHMEGQPERTVDDGVEIIRTDSISIMNDRLPFYRFSKKNSDVFRYLINQRIDYVVINTKFYLISYIAARFAKSNGIPAIVIEHGTGHIDFANPIVKKIGEIYEHILTRLVYRQCDRFVGVSDECGTWLKHFGISTIGTLYNAIDYGGIQKIVESNICDCHDSSIYIAYSGRIMKEKGIYDLAEAYRKLKLEFPDIHLLLIGDGPDCVYLKEKFKCDNDVVFTGRLDFQDVIRKLMGAEVFCFPTMYPEGLPTCVLEAMAVGLYVVTTSYGGAKEVICNDDYGKIIYNYDSEQLADILRDVLNMKREHRHQIAQNGKNRVKEYFTWENTVSKLESIMESL